MTPVLVSMLIIVAIAFAVMGLVMVGLSGLGRRLAPKVAGTMARAVRHLNGDGQPPRMLTRTH